MSAEGVKDDFKLVIDELFPKDDLNNSDEIKISLQTHHAKYLASTPQFEIVANRERVFDWEIWTLKKWEDQTFTLTSFAGKLLSVSPSDERVVSAEFLSNSGYEKWRIEKKGAVKRLRNVKTAKYLCVEPTGLVICDRKKAKKWESFIVNKYSFAKKRIGALCSHKSKFLHFDDLNNGYAIKDRVSETELITFEKHGAYWAMKTSFGTYVGANAEGRVFNISNEITNNEKWTKYKQGNHCSYYQSYHGKFLCADADGVVVADRDKPKKWELWKHEWIN